MSTTPKFRLIIRPMDVIYSALLEGDTTNLLPKITSIPVQILCFFCWTFSDILKILKKNKSDLQYIARRRRVSGVGKLVLNSGTYLCSMQGNMCRITTIRGRSPPSKGVINMQRICRRICLARHETSSCYMANNSKSRSLHKAQ